VNLSPGILARGPWPLERVQARWREEHYEPSQASVDAADSAIAALAERGSPAHDSFRTAKRRPA